MYQITPSRSYRRMTLLYFSTQKRYYPLHDFVVFNYAPHRSLVILLISTSWKRQLDPGCRFLFSLAEYL